MKTPNSIRTAFWVCLTASLTMASCRGDNDDGHSPVVESYDPVLAAEYAALPDFVIIDSDGLNASMRSISKAVSIADASSARDAYQKGVEVAVKENPDDLDAQSSTQAWGPYNNVNNYASYKPQAYSNARTGYSYNYNQSSSYTSGSSTMYVYNKPPCTPAYCKPDQGTHGDNVVLITPGEEHVPSKYDAELRSLLDKQGIKPLSDKDFIKERPEKIELGARLFYDPILSSKGKIACSTCHAGSTATTLPYSLQPTGPVLTARLSGSDINPLKVSDLLPRNTPALFNLGAKGLKNLFWDTRVSVDSSQPSGFKTPAKYATPYGLENVVAAQALFPLVGAAEMGCEKAYGEDQTQNWVKQWNDITARVMAKKEYQIMMSAAYPELKPNEVSIAQIVNAIAAFEMAKWRSDKSPFDQYLNGKSNALSEIQKAGATYFYGKGTCSSCHAGALQTDQVGHAIAMPQIGPGNNNGKYNYEDYGVENATGNSYDRYKFRTPSLRNVAVTGPWGHAGAYSSLKQVVAHYRNPKAALERWDPKQVILPSGKWPLDKILAPWNDKAVTQNIQNATKFQGVALTDEEVQAIVEFLSALTDPSTLQ